jgi:hypothetical protein
MKLMATSCSWNDIHSCILNNKLDKTALRFPELCLNACTSNTIERDSMTDATAIAHAMTVVTRYVADIKVGGVKVFDPWGV